MYIIYIYISDILSDILSGIYSDILSHIVSGIYSDILSDILSGIYSDILSRILSGVFFAMAFYLEFSLACVRAQTCPTASGPGDVLFGSRHTHSIRSSQRRREGRVAPLLKSRDPHLAGGESKGLQ